MKHIILLVLLAAMSPALADEAADRAAILRVYAEQRAAMSHLSSQPLYAALARDAVIVQLDGRPESIGPTIDLPDGQRLERSDLVVPRIVVSGDTAMAIVSTRLTVSSAQPQSASRFIVESVQDAIDDWRRLPEGWRLVHETIFLNRGVPDVASIVAALKSGPSAEAQARKARAQAGSAQVMSQIQGSMANQAIRSANQMNQQQDMNNLGAVNALRRGIWGP